MKKLGLTVLKETPDSPLSPHFGIAKWILIYEPETEGTTFVRNEGLTGKAVVDQLVRHGCTDAIFASIGDGALRHLDAAGIRGWYGDGDQPPVELARLLAEGQLRRAATASHRAPRHHRRQAE
jgi:predicted Fe-Mo cluster-binding NifX family protein